MSKKSRIPEIEIMRVIAAIVIMLFHMGLLSGGLLAVEYFAVLSGLLMARSVSKSMGQKHSMIYDILGYIGRKIYAFYPELIVANLLGILCFNYAKIPFDASLEFISRSIVGNMFLLKMSGLSCAKGGACPPTWYLSSMILSMILIYPILRKIRNCKIFLILGVLLFCYLYFNQGGVMRYDVTDILGGTYSGNIRVCSELLIAIGSYPLIQKLADAMSQSGKLSIGVAICKYISLAGMLVFFYLEHGYTDLLFLLLTLTYLICVFACAATVREMKQIVVPSWLSCCGSVSIAIFLTHSPALMISGGLTTRLGINVVGSSILAFVITMIFSVVTIYGGKRIRLYWVLRKNRYDTTQD